jgi:hypothetical protein
MSLHASKSAGRLDMLFKKDDKEPKNPVVLNRSATVSVGVQPSNLNRINTHRRAVYEHLPFTTVHGLQFKERSMCRVSGRGGCSIRCGL